MPTQQTQSLSDLLKGTTLADHRHAEGRPLERAMAQGKLPQLVYIRYLEQRRFLHEALDRQLRALAAADADAARVLHPRQYQSDNVEADLAYFGAGSSQALPATEQFVQWVNAADQQNITLLGVHYVLEGSKNGARLIAPRVRQAYQLPPGQGDRYLDPHGDEQPALWRDFKEAMNQLPAASDAALAMAEAARETFRAISAMDDAIWGEGQGSL